MKAKMNPRNLKKLNRYVFKFKQYTNITYK